MTETASLTERLAAMLFDPASVVAIALAGMALVAILAFRRRARAPMAAREDSDPAGPTQPIPLLETPMTPVLAAPRRVPTPERRSVSLLSGLAFAAIGIVAVAGLVGFGMRVAGGVPDARVTVADTGAGWLDDVQVLAAGPAGCEAGLDGHADSYTHCGASVPVRFEVLGLAVDGQRLTDAAWSGAGRRAFVLTAPGRPAPFTLDHAASLLAAPGSDLSDYDAYVAVGYADEASDGDLAAYRAEARGLALADVALRQVRGASARDCRSDVMVHAVSLGAGAGGPPPAPLLVGVRIEDRVNRPSGDAGDLNAMLDGLFAGPGAVITGLSPDAYGPWKVVLSERACRRSPV